MGGSLNEGQGQLCGTFSPKLGSDRHAPIFLRHRDSKKLTRTLARRASKPVEAATLNLSRFRFCHRWPLPPLPQRDKNY